MYFVFQVYMLSNSRDITKRYSFCTTMMPRLQQYRGFSPKTAELKMCSANHKGICSSLNNESQIQILTQKERK